MENMINGSSLNKPLQESEIDKHEKTIHSESLYHCCWPLKLWVRNESGRISQVYPGIGWPITNSFLYWNSFQPIRNFQLIKYSESCSLAKRWVSFRLFSKSLKSRVTSDIFRTKGTIYVKQTTNSVLIIWNINVLHHHNAKI